MRTDDLAPLLVPPPSAAVRYGQGKILTWDAETFANKVEWRGVTLTNVPVLAGVSALGYAPGDVVGLLGWAPSSGGIGSWWIIGKLSIPGQDSPDLIVRGSAIRLLGDTVLLAFNTGTLGGEQDGELRPFVSGEGRAAVRLAPSFTVGTVGTNPELTLEGRTSANPGGGMFLSHPAGDITIRADQSAFLISDSSQAHVTAGTDIFVSADGAVVIGSGANEVFIDHGVFSGTANAAFSGDLLFEVSSARRFKTDIRDFSVNPRTVLDLKPRTWRDKGEVAKNPDTDRWHVGFVAEEVEEAGLSAFVDYDQAALPKSVTYDRLTVALLELCRTQQQQIDHLTAWAAAQGYTPPAEATKTTNLPQRLPMPTPARPHPARRTR